MTKTINNELIQQEVHEDFVKGFEKRGWVVKKETPKEVKEPKEIKDTNKGNEKTN
jgi:hypothetical protein